MIRSSRLFVLLATSALVLGACKKKPQVAPTPAPTTTQPAPPTRNDSRPPATDDGAAARAAAEAIARARAAVLSTIYFELDADELRDDARASLDEKLKIMNANPALKVRISGHCDDRGSDEYNIALGRRRSEAAKKYLTDRGIDPSRIETTTFGREKPAMQGTGEDVWSKNRRDEFEITAGNDQLRAP